MSCVLHRLLVISCLLCEALEAVPAPNNKVDVAQMQKGGIGIVEASEKENLITAPDATTKEGKKGAASAPAIGVVKPETAEKPLSQPAKLDSSPSPDSTKASEKSDSAKDSTKAGDAKSTTSTKDDKSKLSTKDDKAIINVARPGANNTVASSISVTNATKAAAVAANSTHVAVAPVPATLVHDLSFWEILVVWNSELLHCIPIVLVAYSLLSLAVHYPSIVDRIAHWYTVRTTTMQTGVLAGKNIKSVYMGRSMPGRENELDNALESGKYSTFSSTRLNHFSSSNQLEL